MKRETLVSLGLAMFTMLFGAGNIVLPLLLGKSSGNNVWIALVGFVITAVVLPVLGFLATVLYEGDFGSLLRNLGKIPGAVMVGLIMMFIGPLCAIPRCVILSYGTLQSYVPNMPAVVFSMIAAVVIFLCACRPALIVKAFGLFLGPLKITLMSVLFIRCVTLPGTLQAGEGSGFFMRGIVAGYETMDLLGALVVTSLMAVSMPWLAFGNRRDKMKSATRKALVVAGIGGGCLSLVYFGFAFSAAKFAHVLQGVPSEKILTALAVHTLGSYGTLVAAVIVLVTCLTTAIVLSAAVARYLEYVFRNKNLRYELFLGVTCFVTAVTSLLEFDVLMHAVEPVVLLSYPVVIVLSLAVIWVKLRHAWSNKPEEFGFAQHYHPRLKRRVLDRIVAVFKSMRKSELRG